VKTKLQLKDSQVEHVVNFGALGYGVDLMARILDLPEKSILEAMGDTGSEFCRAYEKGEAMAGYRIDQKLLEMAQGGDIKALNELEKRGKLSGS
jgi:hypothetical protein